VQLQHAAFLNYRCYLVASVAIAVISIAIAVIFMNINIAALAAIAVVANRMCGRCCRQLYCRRRKIDLFRRRHHEQQHQHQHWHTIECCAWQGCGRNSAYFPPTLRRNAAVSGWFLSMATVRGVLLALQAVQGGVEGHA
jgi:hypothetical protein